MKYCTLAFLLLVYVAVGFAQELPLSPATNKVTYTEILNATAISKLQLFAKAKKWIITKDTEQNPYTITLQSDQEGTIVGKGTFALPGDRRKYLVQYAINIATKDGKCKYEFTDFMIQHRTKAGASGGGWGYYSSSTYREAETLEYSLETFYPSRLTSKKPVIEWYEEIRKKSFEAIDREMQSIVSSFKQTITTKEDW